MADRQPAEKEMELSAEALKQIRRLFRMHDANFSGKLELSELKKALHTCGISQSEITALFQNENLEGSASLDLPEFIRLMESTGVDPFYKARFEAFRAVTGLVRPPDGHGCPPCEIVSALWTAHFHDVDGKPKLSAAVPPVNVVINAGMDKCVTKPGSYGEGIEVVCIDGLLDDPDELKKVDEMAEGPEKVAARAALPAFQAEMCAGDAYRDFDRVSELISKTAAAGGATLVHCHASLSRSVAFILAHLMKTEMLTAAKAAAKMKTKWDAVWPNDTFVKQLLKYEDELKMARDAYHDEYLYGQSMAMEGHDVEPQ